ncbi:uncharacterized protein LOC144656366 [Oculina patagonica]
MTSSFAMTIDIQTTTMIIKIAKPTCYPQYRIYLGSFRSHNWCKKKKCYKKTTMESMVMLGFLLIIILPFVTCMRSGCVDGYCAMENCRSSSGSGFSNFCWMSGNDGGYERCGGSRECSAAVKAGGSCKAFSCAFNRAPDPFTSYEKTCSYKNAKMQRDLQNECSAEGATFDTWAQKYRTSGDLYSKFEPCTGHLIEEETKKAIKFCYCYNFCGTGRVYNGCEVEGLEGRLNREANLFAPYKAICKIDCEPVDKLDRISTLRNELSDGIITKVVTITEGTTSSQTSSSGGSNSDSISATVGANLKSVFSAGLG